MCKKSRKFSKEHKKISYFVKRHVIMAQICEFQVKGAFLALTILYELL